MGDTAKSATLDQAKDRLESTLARLNDLVTEKNNTLMASQAVADERDHLVKRVEQLEALNAEMDVAVTHQALHIGDDILDKKAIITLRDEYEKLKKAQSEMEEELIAAKLQLAAAISEVDAENSDEALIAENAALKEELAQKIRQVNTLEGSKGDLDAFRQTACGQIDSLIGRVETMTEQANG